MQNDISKLKTYLYAAFKEIMNDDIYSHTGNKKYRIFIYIAVFGCIHINDLYVIFPSETLLSSGKNNSEILNIWGTRLNYLSYKNNGLEKLKQPGYYTLSSYGIHILYDHLQFKGYFGEVSFKQFYDTVKINKSFVSHSSKSGRTSLNYVHKFDHSMLCEPLFDCSGRISSCNPSELKGAFFSPDTYFYDKENKENIFIEADSSLENINTQIRVKLSKYSGYYLNNSNRCMNSTIHFSIWNDKDKDEPFLEDLGLLNDILSLYELISETHEYKYDFDKFLYYINGYNGCHEQAKRIFSLIKDLDISSVRTFDELRCILFTQKLHLIYNKKFLTRKKNIINLLKEQIDFYEKFLHGLRFICTPLNIHDYILKYIYIENFYKNISYAELLSLFLLKGMFKIYYKTKEFINHRTGDLIAFRNVFAFEKNDRLFYIIIENIFDDISGTIRVNHYNQNPFFEFEETIYILALYNAAISTDQYAIDFKSRKDNLRFISYDDFDKLSRG